MPALEISVPHHYHARNIEFFFSPSLRGSGTRRKPDRTSNILTLMSARGTSRTYIVERLRREGMPDLADAVEDGQVSAYAIACELGWQKRPEPLGTGSPNEAKRRAWRLRALGF